MEFLENADVVISYTSASTSVYYALIAKKPIIICNFFNPMDDLFLKNQLSKIPKIAPKAAGIKGLSPDFINKNEAVLHSLF